MGVLDVKQTQLRALTEALIKLGADTKIGDTKIYNDGVSARLLDAQMVFEKKLEAEYKGNDKASQEQEFTSSAQSAAKMQQAQWLENDAQVKQHASELVSELKTRYEMQLTRSRIS